MCRSMVWSDGVFAKMHLYWTCISTSMILASKVGLGDYGEWASSSGHLNQKKKKDGRHIMDMALSSLWKEK